MAAGAAAANRSEEIAQRAVAQKIKRLVRHFELYRARVFAVAATGPATMLAFLLQVRGVGHKPLFHHFVDDLLDQILELLTRFLLITVRWLTEQLLQRLLREHAAAEERFEDGVVQRLHRPVLVARGRIAPRVAEPA